MKTVFLWVINLIGSGALIGLVDNFEENPLVSMLLFFIIGLIILISPCFHEAEGEDMPTPLYFWGHWFLMAVVDVLMVIMLKMSGIEDAALWMIFGVNVVAFILEPIFRPRR